MQPPYHDRLLAYPEQTVQVSVAGQPLQLAYRRAGTAGKPVIVLLHGIGSGSGSWVMQLAALSTDYDVIAWSAPGYSSSTCLSQATPSAQDYGAAFSAFLHALAVQPVLCVGHSLGCLMLAAAMQAKPQDYAALMLSCAIGYGHADAALRHKKLHDRLDNLAQLGAHGLAAKRASAMLSITASADLLGYVEQTMAQINVQGYTQAAQMLSDADLPTLLSGLTQDVFFASGELDSITPAAQTQALATQFGAPYFSLGPVGHSCALEGADVLNQRIQQLAEQASTERLRA